MNANLKAKADDARTDVTDVTAMQGMSCMLDMSWIEATTYVMMIKPQRRNGFGEMNDLTTSGSPVNFWPV